WWKHLGLEKTLPFARNRLVESFIWTVGAAYEPQHSYCREVITKLVCLITWVRHCKAYLLEAKWFHSGYKPKLKEYLDNASVSVEAPLILVNAYFAMHPKIAKDAMLYINNCPVLFRLVGMIVRLTDDMETSTAELERGDNIKSIQCYMKDKDVTEEVVREYIRDLTYKTWKKLNAEMLSVLCPKNSLKFVCTKQEQQK
ncbi:Myrcene synthase protein, partial [Thalictrum thalictroides]